MRDKHKSSFLLKTGNILLLKEVLKALTNFYLIVKDLIQQIKEVHLESFRLKMALNMKSSRQDL